MESVSSGAAVVARPLPSVRYLPVSLFGAVMSVAGLALAWRLASSNYGADIAISRAIGVMALLLFAVLAVAYVAKLVKYPQLVKQEFAHPVIGSFFGTIGISILLLSSVIGSYSAAAQLVVWSIGTAATLALSFIMISRLLNGSAAPASVAPAWLIAGVGSLDIVVTGGALPAAWTHEINLLAAAVGGVSAVVFFVLIFSRLIHQEPLAAPMRPSKMILMAPFAVGFIAYVNLVRTVDMFAALLFYFGLFLFVVIAWRLVRRPAPFSPAWWAIGFPLAALASAAQMYANAVGGTGLALIAFLLLVLLTVAVLALAARTLHALFTGRLLTA
ncbi:C4-dicarboxylate ABC transporter [Pseudoduganella sp. FT25W]|uniref:C4-dicarboxylate ABC transporter n=1 Tax=Duganella alba TaxID=2666081 RepID=A0A6L5QQ55_9BURK|nr:C4-dicarboxylate ABC transporter [Duganella alba]MRX11478.1 C4-dicarboxylate ABC transporter [Duganella alba]MRX19635.1 C4-dicarboxylate ABC transporter [Duganella alba]